MNFTLKDTQMTQEGKGITKTGIVLTSAHFQKVPDQLKQVTNRKQEDKGQ